METKDNYRKTIRRAANEINFLTQAVKVIIPFGGSYFMYNTGNGMYRSEYGATWFKIESDDAFQDLVKDFCHRLPRNRNYRFEDEDTSNQFYIEDEDVAVLVLDQLKRVVESYIGTDKPKIYKWISLRKSIATVELELTRMILIDKIKNEFVPSIEDINEMIKTKSDGDEDSIKNNIKKITEVMMDIVTLSAL